MRIEILERIGFEARTQTPGTVLSVPGDASSEEAADWLARGLARVLEEPIEAPAEEPLEGHQPPPQKGHRKKGHS